LFIQDQAIKAVLFKSISDKKTEANKRGLNHESFYYSIKNDNWTNCNALIFAWAVVKIKFFYLRTQIF